MTGMKGQVMEYLVPDYYPSFHCKIGACRAVCCSGWPVTFSMKEYFRLLGVECGAALRTRLDMALHLTERPTAEEYAMLLPRYDGECPLRQSDGRCALQVEAGEDALPAVCRLYPRGVRAGECGCANSCEAVVELLMARAERLRFVPMRLPFEAPAGTRVHFFETGGREMEIRMWLIGFIQDRWYPLRRRLLWMGEALRRMDEALSNKDAGRVSALLSGREAVEVPEASGDLPFALAAAEAILRDLDSLSDSIRDYGEIACARFAAGDANGRERFEALCPDWERWFEHLLVNHMFFTQFPFQDRPVSLRDEITALYAVYAMLRFLSIGAMDGTLARQADIAAALFRMVDHTAFDRYAVPILRRQCGSRIDDLLAL